MNRKQSITEKPKYEESHWKGSLHTAAMVMAQIEARYGAEEASKYDPETNCFTYNTWRARGFHVRKGEKGLLSTTFVTLGEDDGDGGKPASYPKRVFLFYYLQVEPDEVKS